ncbi:MAG: S-layer homology domain-containing protein [Oscillospiraceae bacterium]|nr:S-layer homology domain-containing protein [Oscillospiraceae bacterium]
MKKLLCWALTIALAAALSPVLPVPEAGASGYGPNGNFLAPIEPPAPGSVPISNRTELEAIRHNLGGTYHLANDINLSGPGWTPIGGSATPFTGVFDGQGYVIRNMRIVGEGFEYNGLFARTHNAIIRNLGLEGTEISITPSPRRNYLAGGVSAYNVGGVISNSYNMGRVSIIAPADSSARSGGIVGLNFDGTITDCYNTAFIYAHDNSLPDAIPSNPPPDPSESHGYIAVAADSPAGGTVSGAGWYFLDDAAELTAAPNDGYFFDGWFEDGVFVSSDRVYTFTVTAYRTLTARFISILQPPSLPAVKGRAFAGGIAGISSGIISKCYNTGDIHASSKSSYSHAGGIVGYSGCPGEPFCLCTNYLALHVVTITNCYNTGNVYAYESLQSQHANAGGIVGSNTNIISNVYNAGDVASAGIVGGITARNYGVITNAYWNMNRTYIQQGIPLPMPIAPANPPYVNPTNPYVPPTAGQMQGVGVGYGLGNLPNPTQTQRRTTLQMQNLSFFTGFSPAIWTVNPAVSPYPVFIGQNAVGSFVPVTTITSIPTTAIVGIPHTLFGTVNPNNATHQTITWSVIDAGPTGAVLNGSTLTAMAAGSMTIRATVLNGRANGNYTQDFIVNATFITVTGITGLPSEAVAGIPLTLSGTVNPDAAQYTSIVWNVVNARDTGAVINGNLLAARSPGIVTVQASIINGLALGSNYTQSFDITVNPLVPVTNIISVPETTSIGVNLSLTGVVLPANATGREITWSIHNDGGTGATIDVNGYVLKAVAAGTVAVKATVQNGTAAAIPYDQVFHIRVHPGSIPGWGFPLPPGAAPAFDTASPWAVPHVNQAYSKGFIPPGLQGSYTTAITRGEFVYLAMGWLNYYTGKTDDQLLFELGLTRLHFLDAPSDPVIGAAAALGITAGSGGYMFGVNERFDRQQAAVMLASVQRIVDSNFKIKFDTAPSIFADTQQAAMWAWPSINFVGSFGFMSGVGDNQFSPYGTFTREESITVFNKMG